MSETGEDQGVMVEICRRGQVRISPYQRGSSYVEPGTRRHHYYVPMSHGIDASHYFHPVKLILSVYFNGFEDRVPVDSYSEASPVSERILALLPYPGCVGSRRAFPMQH